MFTTNFEIYLTFYSLLFMENNQASNTGNWKMLEKDDDERIMLLKAKSNEAQGIPKYFLIYKENEPSPLIDLVPKDYRFDKPEELQGIFNFNILTQMQVPF